jgi:hypothetical protein
MAQDGPFHRPYVSLPRKVHRAYNSSRTTSVRPLEIHSCIYRKTPLSKVKSTVYEELPPIPTRMENKLANLLNEEPVPPEPTVPAEAAEEAPKDEKEGEGEDKVEETEETVSAEQLEANKEEVGFQST